MPSRELLEQIGLVAAHVVADDVEFVRGRLRDDDLPQERDDLLARMPGRRSALQHSGLRRVISTKAR